MSSERLSEATIFNTARGIIDSDERRVYLDEACRADADLRERVEKLLAAYAEESQFLEQPAAKLQDPSLTLSEGTCLDASLDAGLAPVFRESEAVIVGNADHSILKALGNTIDIPRVVLRESQAEGPDPVTRPNSTEMPRSNSDSRYQLQGEIARGGMGSILKGRDTDLGRDLAIKVLLDQYKDKPEVIQRFIEEAQIGGQLQHPGIAPIYELGQFSDNRPFFSMKLVKGETLSKLLAERSGPAADRTRFLGIFQQICQTMAYAHSRGVIHRDLKPANIMVGAFGEVQVMDWGLAKVLAAGGVADEKTAHNKQSDVSVIKTMRSVVGDDTPGTFGIVGSQTQMGSVMGTPAYMPPEQALGAIDNLDERADVFGLGAILCEILTGKPPYVAEDGTLVYRMAARGKLDECFQRLETCGADKELIELTKHCLELEPIDRPRDAGVLAERVTQYLESVETKLRQTELAKVDAQARAEELGRRRKLLYAIAAMLLIGLVTAGFAASHFRSLEIKQRTLAQEKSNLANQNQKLANNRELERNIAISARNAEAMQRRIAENAQKSEASLRALAEAREQTIRETLYAAEMNLAAQAAEEVSGISRVLELTHRWIVEESKLKSNDPNYSPLSPGQTQPSSELVDVQRDLRSWEWYYLWSLCHQARLSVPSGGYSVAWSPDGKYFSKELGNGQLRIWDSRSGDLHNEISVGRRRLTSLAYSPDGRKLAIGGSEKLAWIYDPRTGARLTTFSVGYGQVRSLCWSPDGERLAMTLWDEEKHEGEISLWDIESGKRIISIPASPNEGSIDWSPDGNRILVMGHLYDAQTLKLASSPSVAYSQGRDCCFNPRGDLFAMTNFSREIEIRSTKSAELKFKLIGHRAWVESLAWSPAGNLIASAAQDLTVRIWDVDSGRELMMLRGGNSNTPDVRWSPDGKQLVSGDWSSVKVWDYDALSHSFSPQIRPEKIRTLAWDAEGQVLAVGGQGGLQLLDAESGRVLANATREEAGSWSQFSPTVDWISASKTIAVLHGAEVLLLDDHTLEQRLAWKLPNQKPGYSTKTVGASPNGTKIVVGDPHGKPGITVYDAATGNLQTTALDSTQVTSVCWSPDGTQVACGSLGNGAVVDGITGRVVCRLIPESSVGWMQSIAWSPSGDQIAVACFDNTIFVFDAASGSLRHKLLGHTGTVEGVAWSPDGKRLASGSKDRSVRIWNPDNGTLLLTLNGHEDHVHAVAWNPDGMRLASASSDGDIRIWDASAGYGDRDEPRILETLIRRMEQYPDQVEHRRRLRRVLEKIGNQADSHQQDLLERLAERTVSNGVFQLELYRYFAKQGNWSLAELTKSRALQSFEEKLARNRDDVESAVILAEVLLDATNWTVLDPIEMKSDMGAKFSLQADGSILVSGPNTSGDRYSISANCPLNKITALRLEALPDSRLPRRGPGRHSSGNFHLIGFGLQIPQGDGNPKATVIPIASAIASFAYGVPDADITSRIIDHSVNKHWHVWGRFGEAHHAIFLLKNPVSQVQGVSLVVELPQGDNDLVNLGRFRLSVTDDPHADGALRARPIENPWLRLAHARMLTGDVQNAAASFAQAFRLADDDKQRLEILNQISELNDLFPEFYNQLSDNLDLLLWAKGMRLARQGDWSEADAAFRKACALDSSWETNWFQTSYWKAENYPSGLETIQPPEITPDPFHSMGYPNEEGDLQKISWQEVAPDPTGRFSFASNPACHYVLTRIWSPKEQELAVSMGDDDSLRMFLNDKLLFESEPNGGSAREKEHVISAEIRRGWNTMLFKLENASSGGALIVQFSNNPDELEKARIGSKIFAAKQLILSNKRDEGLAALDRLIVENSQNVAHYAMRADAYLAAEQWELAKADFMNAGAIAPEAYLYGFWTFRHANREEEMAEMGLLALVSSESQPTRFSLWATIAPILLEVGKEDDYREQCVLMVNELTDKTRPLSASWVLRASLLLPGTVDPSKLPPQLVTASEDADPDISATRALVAYRNSDFTNALVEIQKSMDREPPMQIKALNLTLQALVQQSLGESEKATATLVRAREAIDEYKAQYSQGIHTIHAEVLYREAEGKIGSGKGNAKKD